MYVDEAGDHKYSTISNIFPVFGLAGCIFRDRYHEDVARQRFEAMKRSFGLPPNRSLHWREIVRRNAPYDFLLDEDVSQEFWHRVNELVSNLEFGLVAAVIRKSEMKAQYSAPRDPYFLALEFLTERFVWALRTWKEGGKVIAEGRRKELDAHTVRTFRKLEAGGGDYLRQPEMETYVHGIGIDGKHACHPGLELADLLVTPVCRHVLGRQSELLMTSLRGKWLIEGTRVGGRGLKVFPIRKGEVFLEE